MIMIFIIYLPTRFVIYLLIRQIVIFQTLFALNFSSGTLLEKWPYSEFFWSVFSRIRTEFGEMLSIFPYSVWIRENTDQKNSQYGHFSRSRNVQYHLILLSKPHSNKRWHFSRSGNVQYHLILLSKSHSNKRWFCT